MLADNIDALWILIIGFMLISTALGYLLFNILSIKSMILMNWRKAIMASSLFLFIFSIDFGLKQFGGYDASALIEPAWRLISGQQPNVDFPCSLPPGFYLGALCSFKVFGVSWYSLVFANAIFGVLIYIWSCWLLKKISGKSLDVLLVAFSMQATNTMLCGFWWYNQITYLAACIYFLSSVALIKQTREIIIQISYVASLMLLALMKPNTAFIEITGTFLVLITSREIFWTIIKLSIIALASYLVILSIAHVDIIKMLMAYLGVSGRAFTFDQIQVYWKSMPFIELFTLVILWIFLVFSILLSLFRVGSKFFFDRQYLLGILLFIAGISSTISDGENRLSSASMMAISSWFLLQRSGEISSYSRISFLKKPTRFLFIALIALGFAEGFSRIRVWSIGPNLFFQFSYSEDSIPGRFFMGFKGSPLFVKLHREIQMLAFGLGNQKIWFGPRLQWAYAAFGIMPEKNQPPWWEAGVSFPRSSESDLVNHWDSLRYDIVVLYRGDTTYLPAELIQKIATEYQIVPGYGVLTVFQRKNTL